MMRQDQESIYATVFMVHDMNREHRAEMMRQAEHARIVREATTGRRSVSRAILGWTGRRLLASGQYLVNRAERPANDLILASYEQK